MMNCRSRHIGLFGGTFDPVHTGHLEVARYVLKHCDISTLLFIPAPSPPHKKPPVASFEDRVSMIRLALQGIDKVEVSLIEKECPQPSYTINTVTLLQQRYPNNNFSLVIGADTLVDLHHWYQYEDLLSKIGLIIAGRAQVKQERIDDALTNLNLKKNNHPPLYLPDIEWPVSSSEIREQLARDSQPEMLPPTVYSYIVSKNLYTK